MILATIDVPMFAPFVILPAEEEERGGGRLGATGILLHAFPQFGTWTG